MSTESTAALVRRYWELMDAADFRGAARLLEETFICDYPQSHERVRGHANFVAINEHYPGRWRVAVLRVIATDEEAASEVVLTNEEGKTERAVSFFEVRSGRIARETDYWPEPYAQAAWRAQWVEPLEDA